MTLSNRIKTFDRLGRFLSQFKYQGHEKLNLEENEKFYSAFELLINRAEETNGWFTKEQVYFAIEGWASLLSKSNLEEWLTPYNLSDSCSEKSIGVIMAGNIPLVGFHDFISVLISGNKIQAKMSSNDPHFIPMISLLLKHYDPYFKERIQITTESLKGFDAVIATGSDNTARYFDYYFGKYPNIIRHNRNSVAVLNGKETEEELERLGEDIFRYFGLGCRNVSKIYVPEDYDFDKLFQGLYKYKSLTNNQKYMNNYDYNKAVFLMSLEKNMLENGFMVLKEDSSFSSPIATLFYEKYSDDSALKEVLDNNKENIQCKVGSNDLCTVAFGQAQKPNLNDYADGVDVIRFLQNLG